MNASGLFELEGLSRELPGDCAPRVPVQRLDDPLLAASGVEIHLLRLDVLHPLWGGNKAFKLLFNLRHALERGSDTVLSFGGPHSNHLHALAAVGRALGCATVGVVRGEEPRELSPTLRDALGWGMRLHFVPRSAYRALAESGRVPWLAAQYPSAFVVPEGADNAEGFEGCRRLGKLIGGWARGRFDAIALACGTGTTLAGLAAGVGPLSRPEILGFAAARDGDAVRGRIDAHLRRVDPRGVARFRLVEAFAGRGFAKLDPDHLAFLREFEARHGVLLDPVYTLKLMYGLFCMARSGELVPGTRLLAIHTGGLQGRRARFASAACRSAVALAS